MTTVRLSTLFLFLSGAASLIYQVTWVRLLSLSIGSTSVSVSIVLATFFLGLALGSFLTTRIPGRFLNTITPYLTVEVIIAGSALVLLPLLLNLDHIVAMWPVWGEVFFFKVALVAAILVLPTICIGATYPLMVSLMIREQAEVGSKLGWLYAVNTAGAVAGAAGSGFLLIPWWGLDGAIYFASALNVAVVLLGLVYKKHFILPALNPPVGALQTKPVTSQTQPIVLAILFITGMVALACEVAWTKYLAIFTHTTIYGFSAILSIFLAGIAIGAWFIRCRIDHIGRPLIWVAMLLSLLAVTLVMTRVGLEYLPTIHAAIIGENNSVMIDALAKYGLILLVLFLPTAILGALFTLNIRLFCGPVESVHNKAGTAYAVNTVGGITGSLLAGLWLIPEYGSDVVLSLSAVLVALTVLLLFNQLKTRQQRGSIAAVIGAVFIGIIYLPPLDFSQMITASRYYFDRFEHKQPPEFRFLQEGRSSVVSVITYDNKHFWLQTNSLHEASVTPPDPFSWFSETLLGLMPYFFLDDPQEIFIVGLGAGSTLSAAALTPAKSIKVVELEPAVEEATHAIFEGGIAALKDSRVNLVFDDARHHLLIVGKSYDAILAQPSHPWLAGSGNLFTKEYFKLVASRLNRGGISVQWLNLFNMDATTLRSILKSYFTVFPHGMTFMVSYENSLILVGSNQPLYFDHKLIRNHLSQPDIRSVLSRWGLVTPYELYRYFSLSRLEALAAAGDMVANSDTNLIPEVRLAWLNQRPQGDEDANKFLGQHFNLDIKKYFKSGELKWLEKFGLYLLSKNDHFRYKLLRRRMDNQAIDFD